MSKGNQPQSQNRNNPRFDNYVEVKDRIARFYEKFPEGRITTEIVESLTSIESGYVTMRAFCFPNQTSTLPCGVGTAHERIDGPSYVNRQGWIFENAETSAAGRACALAGVSIDKGIATREDMERAEERRTRMSPTEARAAKQEEGESKETTGKAEPPAKLKLKGEELQLHTQYNAQANGDGYSKELIKRQLEKMHETRFFVDRESALEYLNDLSNLRDWRATIKTLADIPAGQLEAAYINLAEQHIIWLKKQQPGARAVQEESKQ